MNRFDFYPGDYLRDTVELSAEEDGIYIRLLAWCYSNEKPIPDDRAHVITRADKHRTHWVLNRFFVALDLETGRFWKHNRVEQEIEKAQKQIEANRVNGKKGGRPRKQRKSSDPMSQEKTHSVLNGKPNGLQMGNPNHNPNETLPSPSPSPSDKPHKPPMGENAFDTFWDAYPKKTGKQAAKKIWNRKKPPLNLCLETLALQKASRQWIEGFVPNPTTWLNRGQWEDEVVPDSPGSPRNGDLTAEARSSWAKVLRRVRRQSDTDSEPFTDIEKSVLKRTKDLYTLKRENESQLPFSERAYIDAYIQAIKGKS